MRRFLRAKGAEVFKAISPLVAIVCVLQWTLVQAPTEDFLQFIFGSVLAVVGMLMLFTGVEHGVLPIGRYIGAELPRKGSMPLILAVAAAIGFVTTIAEPDVLVLAAQVDDVSAGEHSGRRLGYIIAAGVGVFSAAALWCIARGRRLTGPLAAVFALMILLSLLCPPAYVPLAYDAGSVTTGVLSAPVLLALGLGMSGMLAGRDARMNGFGLLGLASAGPVLVVLLLGWLG